MKHLLAIILTAFAVTFTFAENRLPHHISREVEWSNPFGRVILMADSRDMYINNRIEKTGAPYVKTGILYVPFTTAEKATGSAVAWQHQGEKITAVFGSKAYSAVGEWRGDLLFVPLKTFTDAINFNTVGWDAKTGTLIITTGADVNLNQMTQRNGQRQPLQWFGSNEAIRIADNILLYQRNAGGWHKNRDFGNILTEEDIKQLNDEKSLNDATVDNGATIPEINFLMKVYEATGIKRFEEGYMLGFNAVLDAQYENGGWPQYLKDRRYYRAQITFNDNAMISILEFVDGISKNPQNYPVFADEMVERCRIAAEKGLQCVLKLQVYNEKLNVWAAWAQQYDQNTLKPAMARAYEPASVGAWESLKIIAYLMKIEKPGIEIQNAIHRAVAWYDYAVVKDWELQTENRNKMAVRVPGARNLWGRFHSLETFEPMFIIVMPKGEENKVLYGIDKYNELPQKSRNSYQFIGDWAKNIKADYEKWKKRNGIE